MTDIQARLRAHYNRAIEHYGESAVLGVFLYGSWNYGTNLPDSDVDTKCIFVPDLFHLAIKPYEVKHLAVDDEVCECMTIMHMVKNWKKQNINFVEILFTPYCIINPKYKAIWEEEMQPELREQIGRYDLTAATLSMAHQAISTLEKKPNDPKTFMHSVRIANTIHRLATADLPYWECLQQDEVVRANRFRESIEPSLVEGVITVHRHHIENATTYGANSSDRWIVDASLDHLIMSLIQYRENVLNI